MGLRLGHALVTLLLGRLLYEFEWHPVGLDLSASPTACFCPTMGQSDITDDINSPHSRQADGVPTVDMGELYGLASRKLIPVEARVVPRCHA